MLKRLYIILLFILGTAHFSFGQCLCGHLFIELELNDLQFTNDTCNYSLHYEGFDFSGDRDEDEFYPSLSNIKNHLKDEKLKFSYATNGGIGTFRLVIKNKSTEEEMVIIATTLYHDIDYYFDLLEFKPGSYLFECEKIAQCVNERNEDEAVIKCGKAKFTTWRNEINPYSVRPLDINDFRIDE